MKDNIQHDLFQTEIQDIQIDMNWTIIGEHKLWLPEIKLLLVEPEQIQMLQDLREAQELKVLPEANQLRELIAIQELRSLQEQ